MSNNINTANMLRVGTIIHGTYRIDRYLSSGGFGNTYVATNIQFGEQYAITEFFMRGISQRDDNNTTVSVSNTDNRETFASQLEKFKKEAGRLRKLNNEHIGRVHDLFEENGTAYYVMDYIEGENLSERLKRTGKPLSEAEVMQLLPQILDALEAAHKDGILHLDLKPANIMVDKQGVVKLIDFGASKQQSAQGGATTSTAVSYTNGYAPREQMEQNLEKFGPWTDFYALGATLYTLLTNKKPPLPSDIDDDGSEDKHLALPMPIGCDDKRKKMILWLMSTNRKDRPQNVETFREQFELNVCYNVEQKSSLHSEDETMLADTHGNKAECQEQSLSWSQMNEDSITPRFSFDPKDIVIFVTAIFFIIGVGLYFYSTQNEYEEYKNNVTSVYPIHISKIEIGNTDENNNVISDYGKPIYDYQTKYLSPRIYYYGFGTGCYTLKIKIFNPDGTLSQGGNSPKDCSYTSDLYVDSEDGNTYFDIGGWGGNDAGHWWSGSYRLEVWYGNTILYVKHFKVLFK